MKLSRDEERFLRAWMYDEVHYHRRRGPAKELQLKHHAAPAELATLIAAAIPDLAEQEAAGETAPNDEPLVWPWSDMAFQSRLEEAHATLAAAKINKP